MSKFKIGDRVRVLPRNVNLPHSGHGVQKGETFTVRRLRGDDSDNLDTELWSFYSHEVGLAHAADPEPLPVAALQPALKLEAGHFYKTRDGRKVGPMRDDRGILGYRWEGHGSGQFYKDHGAADDGKEYDLIAEWHDTSPVSAQVDAIAEEYGPAVNDNAAKPKFKVGDRVVAHNYLKEGDCYGTIDSISPCRGRVHASNWTIGVRRGDLPADRIELADAPWSGCAAGKTPKTPAIVALIENGQPKPSSVPHVHTDQVAAEREAKRLASIHKGQQFGVFVLASVSEEAKPVYAHEWQRLAAVGWRSLAVSSLVRTAGIPKGHAERIVGQFAA